MDKIQSLEEMLDNMKDTVDSLLWLQQHQNGFVVETKCTIQSYAPTFNGCTGLFQYDVVLTYFDTKCNRVKEEVLISSPLPIEHSVIYIPSTEKISVKMMLRSSFPKYEKVYRLDTTLSYPTTARKLFIEVDGEPGKMTEIPFTDKIY